MGGVKENNMTERLTTRFHGILVKEADVSKIQIITKLGQLEDIMDKYGIESVELLEHIIKKGIVINSTIEDFAKEEYDKMKQDRNTWKKACELACEREDDCYVYDNIHRAYEFYQQAKKEGDDE